MRPDLNIQQTVLINTLSLFLCQLTRLLPTVTLRHQRCNAWVRIPGSCLVVGSGTELLVFKESLNSRAALCSSVVRLPLPCEVTQFGDKGISINFRSVSAVLSFFSIRIDTVVILFYKIVSCWTVNRKQQICFSLSLVSMLGLIYLIHYVDL